MSSGKDSNETGTSVVTYERHEEHFQSSAYSTSSLAISIQQLQNELQTQYQHDKHALTELNQRFRLLIDRIQLLESQNLKYVAQIEEFRQQLFDITDWNKRYVYLQSDLTTISGIKVDYEFEFELAQLQIGIYRQLIDVEQQWKYEQRLKLEQEVKESASALVTIRASYTKLEQENTSIYAVREDKLKQCLSVTHDWCSTKKQRKKQELSIQILKRQLVCYKNLHSYSKQIFESMPVESIDVKQFWSLELEKCMKKIRRDFEILYEAIYHQMILYYQTKMEEMHTEVEQAVRIQQIEIEELALNQQRLQMEYEEVQKSLFYEKEILIELEAKYSSLESELKSIQFQHDERFEAQSKEIHSEKERIVTMSCDIQEIRRCTMNLEVEIIIYRDLLDTCEITTTVVSSDSGRVETVEKLVVENETKRQGSIGIKECATSGRYISLMNHSTNKDIDISRWVLKRRVESAAESVYTIPEGVWLRRGEDLIIYSKLGASAAKLSSTNVVIASSLHQYLVCDNVTSWGMGITAKTVLLNQNGEEKASHNQWIVFGRNNM